MEKFVTMTDMKLVYEINRSLIELGLKKSFFPIDGYFNIEDLDKIKNIKLDSMVNTLELSLLKNLKSLVINQGSGENIDANLRDLPQLERLIICNNSQLNSLDIMDLKSLKELIIINNCQLNNLTGIEQLTKLEKVIICGNKIRKLDDPILYIQNTSNTKTNILDVMMYQDTFGESLRNRNFLEKNIVSGWSNISFGEVLLFDSKCYEISYYQMRDMYNKAKKIISNLKLNDDTDIDKVYKVYDYIVKTLKYDYNALNYRSEEYYNAREKNIYEDEYFSKRFLVINTSYGAIMLHKAVCEGYVNMMILLLNICGIESEKVSCKMRNSNSNSFDHVAIKFKIDNKWYYADPEREQVNQQVEFFALEKSDFQKTHYLNEDSEEIVEYKK